MVLNVMTESLVRTRTELHTSVGTLVPSYTYEEDGRKKEARVRYYPTGELRSVPLEDSTCIKTSAGFFSCELITFYKSGRLRRIFPLNGRISAYWTEEDEYGLVESVEVGTPAGILRVKPIYLQFYETGELQSIGLWPAESIKLETPAGPVNVRKGISFHKNGAVAGCEPAKETLVETPIGKIKVYNPDPEGIYAESDTLAFDGYGRIVAVSTVKNSVVLNPGAPEEQSLSPDIGLSYCDESTFIVIPLRIRFDEGCFTCINKGGSRVFKKDNDNIFIQDFKTDREVRSLSDPSCLV